MEDPISIKDALAGRRFGAMILALFAAMGLYGALWAWAAGAVKTRFAEFARAGLEHGIALTASGVFVEGFPYRLELHLEGVVARGPGWSWASDHLAIHTLPYRLDQMVLVFDRPQTIGLGDRTLRLVARDARASLVRGGAPRARVAVDLAEVTVTDASGDPVLTAARLQYHSRPAGDSGIEDLVWRFDHVRARALAEAEPDLGPDLALAEAYVTLGSDGARRLTEGSLVWGALDLNARGALDAAGDGVIDLTVKPNPVAASVLARRGLGAPSAAFLPVSGGRIGDLSLLPAWLVLWPPAWPAL